LGKVGDRAELRALEDAVGDPNAHHEVRGASALAAGAADDARAIALRVDAPPAQIRLQPRGRNRLVPRAEIADDLAVGLPRVELALQSLRALRFRLFRCVHAHSS